MASATRPLHSLMVWGCTSHAGKSLLATALCRWAARQGLRVAPFKAQNMSNNARVVARADGGFGEIGSAQYLQALAARCAPDVHMNPVLLKPWRDTASQVVLQGRVAPGLADLPWRERSRWLAEVAHESFQQLPSRFDRLVIEGAGSPAEINLAASDYVNLGAARWAVAAGSLQALLVADIDRGGGFAHLFGTWQMLPDDLRGHLSGHVLNQFRGDASLLAPGPELLQQRTGVPVVGVLPMWREHGLPDEDGLFNAAPSGGAHDLQISVLALPHISNLDEFAPLRRVPGLNLRWVRSVAELAGSDWIILPGSKQVSGDLAWLRAQGLDAAVALHVLAGRRLLGICGGLQMLGQRLNDPQGHDGQRVQDLPGLGHLPLYTEFGPDKRLLAASLRFGACHGPWSGLAGVSAQGYEIRCGQTWLADDAGPDVATALMDDHGAPIGWQRANVLGLYAHGLFESAPVLQALFGVQVPTLDTVFDGLADFIEEHIGPARLRALLLA